MIPILLVRTWLWRSIFPMLVATIIPISGSSCAFLIPIIISIVLKVVILEILNLMLLIILNSDLINAVGSQVVLSIFFFIVKQTELDLNFQDHVWC